MVLYVFFQSGKNFILEHILVSEFIYLFTLGRNSSLYFKNFFSKLSNFGSFNINVFLMLLILLVQTLDLVRNLNHIIFGNFEDLSKGWLFTNFSLDFLFNIPRMVCNFVDLSFFLVNNSIFGLNLLF